MGELDPLNLPTVGELAELAQELDQEQFAHRHPDPALVYVGGAAGLDHDTGFRTLDPDATPSNAGASAGVSASSPVWWVRKIRSTFPDKITVGRSSNNDIAIKEPNISKLHGYITKTTGSHEMIDADSRNGTVVDGSPLTPMEARRLEDGAVIELAGTTRLMYCLPGSLWSLLRSAMLQ